MSRTWAIATSLCFLAAIVWAQEPASQPAAEPPAPATAPAAGGQQAGGQIDLSKLSIPEITALIRRGIDAGALKDAYTLVTVLLQRDNNNLEGWLLSGEIATLAQQPEAAREAYLRARGIQSNDFRANIGLGRIYNERKLYRQATAYLETADSVCPPERKGEVALLLANAYGGAGQIKSAFAALERALQLDPDNLEALEAQTKYKTAVSDFEAAMDASSRLVAVARRRVAENPTDRTAIAALDQAYDVRNTALITYHRTLYALNPDGSRSNELIPGRETLAAAQLREFTDLILYRAELARLMQLFRAIDVSAEVSVRLDPQNVAGLLTLAGLYAGTSQFDKAIATYEQALQVEPGNATAQQQLEALRARLSGTAVPAVPSVRND